jgi:hypothetical protein
MEIYRYVSGTLDSLRNESLHFLHVGGLMLGLQTGQLSFPFVFKMGI